MKCRHCKADLEHVFLDLGFAPPSNAYLDEADLLKPEIYYPLKVMVCNQCWLVQTEDYADASELFAEDYAYLSSTSISWLAHAKKYTEEIIQKLELGHKSKVVEIASNDGYLLKNFLEQNIPCLGIEPTTSTADIAEQAGIPVLREFFGEALGKKLALDGEGADLIIGNNVYAHVPDINDFTAGIKNLLNPGGTITLEFPHLLNLIKSKQFDTIYHEHFSYLSLYTVTQIFASCGLRVLDVEELPSHGGSLRIYGCHDGDSRKSSEKVMQLMKRESEAGLQQEQTYVGFQDSVNRIKNDLLEFLIQKQKEGKKVLAYGAAAKGNTLLNYAGVKADLLPMVFDAAKSKQGRLLPGSHIPVMNPDHIASQKCDYMLILPWNIADEVKTSISHACGPETVFVIAVPELEEV